MQDIVGFVPKQHQEKKAPKKLADDRIITTVEDLKPELMKGTQIVRYFYVANDQGQKGPVSPALAKVLLDFVEKEIERPLIADMYDVDLEFTLEKEKAGTTS